MKKTLFQFIIMKLLNRKPNENSTNRTVFFMFKIISEWLLKVLKYFKGRKKIKDF